MVVVVSVLRQTGYDAGHVQIDKLIHFFLLSYMVFMRVGTYHREAVLPRIVFYAVEHAGIIMRHQIGHNNAQNVRSLLSQALREGVGAVVLLLGQLTYLLSHGLTYLVAVTQCARHSSNAHA